MQPTSSNLETPLPRAVRDQMKRVDARLADRAAARSAAAASTPAPKPDDGAPAGTPAAEPAPQPSSAAPVPNAAPAQTPPAPSADSRENDPVYWRDRFRLMQGINDKLRSDHTAALQDRDQQLGDLRERVQELEQQLAARPAGNDKIDLTAFFNPEQIERFGEDQCETMAKVALKAASDQAQRVIDAEVKPLKEARKADKDREIQAAETAFWDRLAELQPDYDVINADPSWLQWLRDADDDGEPRQKRLDRHRAARNAQGVANVFRDYLKTKQPTLQPPVAAPRGAGGGGQAPEAPANVPGKGYPSREEIKEFHKRAATIRNPRDPRYVTDKERAEFDSRMRLPKPQ